MSRVFNQFALSIALFMPVLLYAATEPATLPTLTQSIQQAIKNDELIESAQSKNSKKSVLENKVLSEHALLRNDRGILSHNLNYFIPVSYKSKASFNNQSPSLGVAPTDINQRNLEAKFQFSFKAAIVEVLPKYKSKIFFGFTAKSWWQVYSNESSSPFRETNYEPEIFWEFPFRIKPINIKFLNTRIGLSHQSNGQNIPYSRSWNRVFATFEWEDGDWIYQFKPWYRLPEAEKESINDVNGDDNPDISKFMGKFELRAVLQNHRNEIAITFRNNLHRNDNRGYIGIDWIFPTKQQLQPYIQISHGFGDSLIDYNEELTRIGFGLLLSDWY